MFAACAGTFPVLALAEASYSDVAIECFQAAADDRWSTRELCEEAANRGSPHAMLILAERTESDSRKAGLLSRAVELDYAPAMVALGEILDEQARVFDAEALYFRAADLDYGPGMIKVAKLLSVDASTDEDFEPVRKALFAAAQDGYSDAQYELALMCRDGIGGPSDLGQAEHWIYEAATAGHTEAQYELAMAHLAGGSSQGLRWLVKAARGGHVEAMYQLAVANTDAVVTARNLDEALYWAREALGAGQADAHRLVREIEWRLSNPEQERSPFHPDSSGSGVGGSRIDWGTVPRQPEVPLVGAPAVDAAYPDGGEDSEFGRIGRRGNVLWHRGMYPKVRDWLDAIESGAGSGSAPEQWKK